MWKKLVLSFGITFVAYGSNNVEDERKSFTRRVTYDIYHYPERNRVWKDIEKALKLFDSAKAGDCNAYHKLTKKYIKLARVTEDNNSVKEDYLKEAEKWYKGIDTPDPAFQFELAELFAKQFSGRDIYPNALSLYEAAAASGHVPSARQLGLRYFYGNKIAQSDELAEKYLIQAVNQFRT